MMISPTSRIAVLFASLIVSANADIAASERASGPKLVIVRNKPSTAAQGEWLRAISSDNVSRLSALLDAYDAKELISITADNGKSALMSACKKGDLALVRRLVAAGAAIDEKTVTQGTPFMFAVLGGHQGVVRWLSEQGADIHAIGSNGWTALTIAAAKGNVTLLQWLIQQGADAQVRDVYRYTPLLRAVDNGFLQTAALLLSLPETDIHARDEYDNTALHHAVFASKEDMVSLLLEHGADPTMKNRDGLSAIDVVNNLSRRSEVLLEQLKDKLTPGL